MQPPVPRRLPRARRLSHLQADADVSAPPGSAAEVAAGLQELLDAGAPAHTGAESVAEEARYDREMLAKVAALAQRLQSRQQETLSAAEMEAIGAEVGLAPTFMRQALALLTRTRELVARPRPQLTINPRTWGAFAGAWWAAGWTVPLMLVILGSEVFDGPFAAVMFFFGWAVYIGGGILISHFAEEDKKSAPGGKVPRTQLLETLFALQRELEGQKQHRAFLSVDVVGSSEMKWGASDLVVEYSFARFHEWVQEVVRASGGEMQSAAGDGVMCIFPDDAAAVRAGRQLQEGMAQFNAGQNRLATPFRIRCGVSAGEVAVDPSVPLGHLHSAVIDRAAARQRHAAPGQVVVGAEVTSGALRQLDTLAPLDDPAGGDGAFAWGPR